VREGREEESSRGKVLRRRPWGNKVLYIYESGDEGFGAVFWKSGDFCVKNFLDGAGEFGRDSVIRRGGITLVEKLAAAPFHFFGAWNFFGWSG
jgi:hypothetical protein